MIIIIIKISLIKFNENGKEKLETHKINHHILNEGNKFIIPLLKNNNRLFERS